MICQPCLLRKIKTDIDTPYKELHLEGLSVIFLFPPDMDTVRSVLRTKHWHDSMMFLASSLVIEKKGLERKSRTIS